MMKMNFKTTFFALGTGNTISVFDFEDKNVVKNAAGRVMELHHLLSTFSDDSDISHINQAAGKNFVKVQRDTFQLIKEAKKYAHQTDGAFDPAIRPLVTAWDIGGKKQLVPKQEKISKALRLIDENDILMDQNDNSVMLRKKNMAIDLSGIAKGFACDEVRRLLSEGGVENGIVNLGGTVSVIGAPQKIGIQYPYRQTGVSMGSLELTNKTAVTSGSYEKCFQQNGKFYHHILDPRTGYPAASGLLSVTLIGESASALDALATAVFVMGIEKGSKMINQLGLEAIFITTDQEVLVTAGLKTTFHLSKENETYYEQNKT